MDRATNSGATPIEVMLGAMRARWEQAQKNGKLDIEIAKDAHAIAKDVAPYVHPRLQAIEYTPATDPNATSQGSGDLVVLARKLAFLVRLGEREVKGQVVAEQPAQKPTIAQAEAALAKPKKKVPA